MQEVGMELSEIQSNVKRIKAELATGNPFGEKVLLVAATKMQSADAINGVDRRGRGRGGGKQSTGISGKARIFKSLSAALYRTLADE